MPSYEKMAISAVVAALVWGVTTTWQLAPANAAPISREQLLALVSAAAAFAICWLGLQCLQLHDKLSELEDNLERLKDDVDQLVQGVRT